MRDSDWLVSVWSDRLGCYSVVDREKLQAESEVAGSLRERSCRQAVV